MKNKSYVPALKYDWLTKMYDHIIGVTMPEIKFKMALVNQAKIKKEFRVLDFGVGTATLSLLIKKHYKEVLIHGVDVDQKILSIAQKKIDENKENIVLDKYDGATLPYENHSFDRVVSSLVFHHLSLSQKRESLSEIHRVLVPGGELHIVDWGKPTNSLMRFLFYIVQIFDGFESTNDNVKGFLPDLIKEAGFNDTKSTFVINTIFGTVRGEIGKKLSNS